MFYLLSIFIPIGIALIAYLILGFPKDFFGHIKVIIKVLPYIFLYALLLYFLQMENYFNSGWAFISLMFFLVPITVIVIGIYLFRKIRKR